MYNITLLQPGNTYDAHYQYGSGGVVSGGGTNYAPREFVNNGSFEGTESGWNFVDGDQIVGSPSSTFSMTTDEGRVGIFSANVNIVSTSEWFCFDIYSEIDNGGYALIGNTLNMEAWFKTTATNLEFVVYGDPGTTLTTAIASTGGEWQLRTFTWNITGRIGNDVVMVGVRTTTGTAAQFYMDGFRAYSPQIVTDVPVNSYVTFSPAWNNATVAGGEDMVLIFENGGNANIGSEITSVTAAGTAISRIDLADVLPVTPVATDRVLVILPNDPYVTNIAATSLGDVATGLTTATTIEMGFSTASFNVPSRVLYQRAKSYDVTGWAVNITGPSGIIFDGIVNSVAVGAGYAKITVIGFRSLFEKTSYVGYFASSPEVTMEPVLLDVLSACTVINSSNLILDRGGTIGSAQSAGGGIGPLDFESSPYTVAAAIDDVLKLGTYDDTYDMLFIQIYDGRVPRLKRVGRSNNFGTPDWVIGRENLAAEDTELTIDRTNMANTLFTSYKSDGGDQLETARAFSIRDVIRHGRLEQNLSSSDLSEAEAYMLLSNEAQTKIRKQSLGQIKLSGSVVKYGYGPKYPVEMIRSGDIIFMPSVHALFDYDSSANPTGEYVIVGATEFDASSRIVTITPYDLPTKFEYLMGILEIE